jgi:outer membrane protein assembly factor BamB
MKNTAITLLAIFSFAVFSQDYARFHGDYNDNSGMYADTVLKPPLKLRWRYFTEGSFKGSPIVYKGRLFANDRQGQIYCLNAETGDLIWKKYHLTSGEGIIPLAYGDYLYYHAPGTAYDNRVGFLKCVRQDNGDSIWTKDSVGGSVASRGKFSPIGFNGNVYFFGSTGSSGNTATLYCFNALTGQEAWRKTYGPIADSDGLIVGHMVICTAGASPLLISGYTSNASENWRTKYTATFALNAATGDSVWQRNDYGGTLTLYDTVIYMNSNSAAHDEFVAASALTGEIIYTADHSNEYKSSADADYIYSRGYGGSVRFYDRLTGASIGSCDWSNISIPAGGRVLSGCGYPSLANGYGYCGFGHGGYSQAGYDPPGGIPRADKAQGVYAFKIPPKGSSTQLEVVWYYKMASNICTTPFIYQGKIYFTTNQEGVIYCFENAQ